MTFLLMHQTVVLGDAIGHDILAMYRVLEDSGHQCYLFCEYAAGVSGYKLLNLQAARPILDDPGATIVYHHSIHWSLGEELLSSARAKIVLKYHNITPPNYFASVPEYCEKCVAGREQTYRFINRFPAALWLTDSRFNLRELGLDQVVRYRVVPPFLNNGPDSQIAPTDRLLSSLVAASDMQALFVGRFVPNKGHLFLLRVLQEYRRHYGNGLTLFVVGKRDECCRAYYDEVLAESQRLDLSGMFRYVGEATPEDLLAYFMGCDAYLCCSEHEGFCVPVVESQCMCLPVVARATGAVRETIGGGHILHGDDPAPYAHSLNRIFRNSSYRDEIIETGRRNYEARFTHAKVKETFLGALSEFLGHRI